MPEILSLVYICKLTDLGQSACVNAERKHREPYWACDCDSG